MGGLVAIEWVKQQRNPRITGIILSSPCLGLQIKVNKALDLASKGLNVIAPSLKVDSGLSIDMATRNEDVIEADQNDSLYVRKVSVRWYRELLKTIESAMVPTEAFLKVPLLVMQAGDDKLAYGELEFWFALIKIVAILSMIAVGLLMIIAGVGNGGIATGISNLWNNGGFFPHGLKGVLLSLQMVMFAYLGIEMIGVTAGEVKNPQKSLAKAIDTVFWRILIFYVGALFVIMSIYPWQEIGSQGSPFVLTFQKVGIPSAAGIINFVVLTAALSSCNSGIFSTGRMLFNLAEQKEAPQAYGQLTKGGIPGKAVLASAGALLVGVLLNYVVPAKVFTWVTSIATFGAIWTWAIILLSQIKYRKSLKPEEKKQLKYKMPLFPFTSYVSLAFLAFVVILMAYSPDTRVAVIIGPIWFLILLAVYYGKGFHKKNAAAASERNIS